jgi:hypothetical protein
VGGGIGARNSLEETWHKESLGDAREESPGLAPLRKGGYLGSDESLFCDPGGGSRFLSRRQGLQRKGMGGCSLKTSIHVYKVVSRRLAYGKCSITVNLYQGFTKTYRVLVHSLEQLLPTCPLPHRPPE